MDIEKYFLKKIKKLNSEFNLFDREEKYLLALSGGIDSLVLTRVLRKIVSVQNVYVVHLYPYFEKKYLDYLKKILEKWGYIWIDFLKHPDWGEGISCYQCARFRRKVLFEKASELGIKKVIYGHTGEDVIETFWLNQIYHARLETIAPKQEYFGEYFLLRPLYYLLKDEVERYGRIYHIKPVAYSCKGKKVNRRNLVRSLLKKLSSQEKKNILKASLFVL